MPITGRVDYTSSGIAGRTPNGAWTQVGEDAQHYIGAGSNTSGSLLKPGCAETNALLSTISETVWADAVRALDPSLTGDYNVQSVLPVPGTPYVGAIGVGDDNLVNDLHVVGVFWKVNTGGTAEVVGGFAYEAIRGGFDLDGAGNVGEVGGTIGIAGELYFTINTRGAGVVLAHVPYTSTEIDLNSGSWNDRCTELPAGFVSEGEVTGGRNAVVHSLQDAGSGIIRVFQYFGTAEGGPSFIGTNVNPTTQTTTGTTDLAPAFGIPFSDTGLRFDGTAGSIWDDYIAPSVNGTAVTFLRPFSDNIDTIRVRDYTVTSLADITVGDVTDVSGFTIVSVNGALEGAFAFDDSGERLLTLRDRRYFYFHQYTLATPPEPEPEPEPTPGLQPVTGFVRSLPPLEKPPIAVFRVGSEGRAKYPLSFFVFEAQDLRVTIDDVELASDEFSFAGSIVPYPGYDDAAAVLADSDYHRKQASVPGFRGGVVTLATPVTDSIVTIWNDPIPQRGSDSAELMRRDLVRGEFNGRIAGRIFGDLWATHRALKLKFARCVATADTAPLDETMSGTLLIQ